jgi:hypothetical protein
MIIYTRYHSCILVQFGLKDVKSYSFFYIRRDGAGVERNWSTRQEREEKKKKKSRRIRKYKIRKRFKKTPWSESANELHRPSDRRSSAKWLPTFCGLRVPRGQRDGSLRPYSRFSRQDTLLFYQVAPQLYSRGWVDPVPDPLLFSLVVLGIETGPLDL